ncbi:MAG: polynucleotide adenylyltransferase [Pycnora praestabilis]|nr:MAG: polynucleotide adenylyltransferase [Pycnora praestabilis]
MSTKKIIIKELERGGDVVDQIFAGKLQWKDLFTRHSFFTEGYRYYLSIVAASRSKEAQLIWSGLVESKVRLLVADLENVDTIDLAHPFNKGFDRVHLCHNEEEVEKVLHGDLEYQMKDIKTETTDSTNDPKHDAAAQGGADKMEVAKNSEVQQNGKESVMIHTTTYYVGIEIAQIGGKRLDISYQSHDFQRKCTSWQQYDSEMNSLNIVTTRSHDLPSDVFEPGEVRPTRAKKIKANKSDGGSKKRNLGAAGLEVPSLPLLRTNKDWSLLSRSIRIMLESYFRLKLESDIPSENY